jgi:hypothetical protein
METFLAILTDEEYDRISLQLMVSPYHQLCLILVYHHRNESSPFSLTRISDHFKELCKCFGLFICLFFSHFDRNDKFLAHLLRHSDQSFPQLLSPLFRQGKLFWNQTVNKMTANVLKKLYVSEICYLFCLDSIEGIG